MAPGTSDVDGKHPLYRRTTPELHPAEMFSGTTDHIDLSKAHAEPYGPQNTLAEAVRLFGARAAATISAAVGINDGVSIYPSANPDADLLEQKSYPNKLAPTIYLPTAKCLAALAFNDFFPGVLKSDIRSMVSQAVLAAGPGWCGSIGPGIDGAVSLLSITTEGNYDMSQMHLLAMAYAYYDVLSSEAREHLITQLLARGRIHRVNEDDTFTSGPVPNDWERAGYISPLGVHKRIGETENHILTILTARYLTNQLMYQRTGGAEYDNRRNGGSDYPACITLVLELMRNILRDDFSEYNAKNYQDEVRSALLNLCSYAYDHEVRLAARMVLDYVSAHIVVSSTDLRRMVPFRRRNEKPHVTSDANGFLQIGLVETSLGADPLTQHFAILAGNTRVYANGNGYRPGNWTIKTSGEDGNEAVMDVLTDYRIPPSIHDLFVTDLHRRFFQRLHRTPQGDPDTTGRNCDNMEIYAGSPSYLITAGGSPATFAISPYIIGIDVDPSNNVQQIGVAYSTSFIPTTQPSTSGITRCGNPSSAADAIQFSHSSDTFNYSGKGYPGVNNYGVGPDFACGHVTYLPQWAKAAAQPPFSDTAAGFHFIDMGAGAGLPGFYLAIYKDGNYGLLEAFDTWLYPGVSFERFKQGVSAQNAHLNLHQASPNGEQSGEYTTFQGTHLKFVIWQDASKQAHPTADQGAVVLEVRYSSADSKDAFGDAGNVTNKFLNGTVLNSSGDGLIRITNPFLGTTLTLDMQDQAHPKRISENGEVEQAGYHNEVWVNFSWKGAEEGDFFHPFNTLAGAVAAVADHGVIKIMPGTTTEKLSLNGKQVRVETPIGGVKVGS